MPLFESGRWLAFRVKMTIRAPSMRRFPLGRLLRVFGMSDQKLTFQAIPNWTANSIYESHTQVCSVCHNNPLCHEPV
jgi:hypothetical protein